MRALPSSDTGTVTQLPIRRDANDGRPERYLTRAELAAVMNVSLSQIDRWVHRDGCPSHTFGMRRRRFLLSRVEAWLLERERGSMAA